MSIGQWLKQVAQADPKRPALFAGMRQIADYGQFDQRAAQVGAWLRQAGIQPGDRIALYLKNQPDYLILLYGVWYAEAVAVPVNAKLHPREAGWIMANAQVKMTFAGTELGASLVAQGCEGLVIDLASQLVADTLS